MFQPRRSTCAALAILLAVMAWSCRPSEQAPAVPAAHLVITGATLIDGTGAPPRANQTIIIHDGRIAEVARDGESVPAGSTVIDAAGKYVVPGLADMHAHFSLGAPLPRRDDETVEVLARYLYYGVTTILQVGGTDASTASIQALRARRAAGELQAPYIYGTGGHLTLHGTHPVYTIFPEHVREAADAIAAATPLDEPADLYPLGIGISFVRTEEAARKAVRERAAGGMDAIKITVETGPTPFGNVHPKMPLPIIRAIVDEARQHGLRVFAHVTSLDELDDVLDGGAAGVLHAVSSSPLPEVAAAGRMRDGGFFYVPTLALYENFIGYWNDPGRLEDPFLRATVTAGEIASFQAPGFVARHRRTFEFFDRAIQPAADGKMSTRMAAVAENVGQLHAGGVGMVVGTDAGNPFTFPGYSVHQELELLVRAGLTPMEALVAGTRRAAEMLGREDEFGTIQVGRRADLLILGANPLDDIRNTRSLEVVISEGRVVDRDVLLARGR